jgi:hypothetical protein
MAQFGGDGGWRPVLHHLQRFAEKKGGRFGVPAQSRCGLPTDGPRGRTKIPNDINLSQKGLRLHCAAQTGPSHLDAGWSSPVARQAHNLKVISSNLVPATNHRPETINKSSAWKSPAELLCVFTIAGAQVECKILHFAM